MGKFFESQRFVACALAAGTSLALTGCFMSPGEFDATLELHSDRSFAFSYDGQIYAFALDDLSEMAADADPDDCHDDTGKTRPCTAEELEEQKASRVRQAQAMKQMMSSGDVDSGEEMAELLERQAGWNEVAYLGDGLFDVDFSVRGSLDYDFTFPTVEGMPAGGSFVSVILRDDDKVRIEAPGFSAMGGNPMTGMFGSMMGMFTGMDGSSDDDEGDGKKNPFENMVQPSGTFRIVTDCAILANNTDEGPSAGATGQVLEWDIGPQTAAAPTALIGL